MVELGFSNNDLDEKFHKMAELIMEDPSIGKVIDNQARKAVTKVSILIFHPMIFYRVHEMRQRNMLDDNEWPDGLQVIRN